MAPQLPLETLEHVVSFASPSDLFHISITQHVLGAMAEKRLYQSLTVLTNAEKLYRGPWFWGSTEWVVCLRRSVLAQLALIRRPNRFQYVRFVSLDGHYHWQRRGTRHIHGRNLNPKTAELDEVIDPIHLVRMVNVREVECIGLRIESFFQYMVYTIKGLESLCFIGCSFYTPEGLDTVNSTLPRSQTRVKLDNFTAEPVNTSGWDVYVQNGLKQLIVGKSTHAKNLLGTLRTKRVSDTLTALVVTWDIPDDVFMVALLDALSSSQSLTSVTIEPIIHAMPIFTLPEAAVPRLKVFVGPHTMAPTFIRGRPVVSVGLKCLRPQNGEHIDRDILSFLRLSTAEVTELRFHFDLGTDRDDELQEWLGTLGCISDYAPSVRRLVLGSFPMIADLTYSYLTEVEEAILPSLKDLVELHFDPQDVFDRVNDGQTHIIGDNFGRALRDGSPCKLRDHIVRVCAEASLSLRRIVFGDEIGWGGCERLKNGEWVKFFFDKRHDFWKVAAVGHWPSPPPDAGPVTEDWGNFE